jgi:DNA-binding response OmpR family regulator
MGSPRTLVVEDDHATRGLMQQLLQRKGWMVATAGTLAEARARLDEAPPDLIVLELTLPDGAGEDLLRQVRAGGLPTRVVVATDCRDPIRLSGLTLLGADAVLRKPIDPNEVSRACGEGT